MCHTALAFACHLPAHCNNGRTTNSLVLTVQHAVDRSTCDTCLNQADRYRIRNHAWTTTTIIHTVTILIGRHMRPSNHGVRRTLFLLSTRPTVVRTPMLIYGDRSAVKFLSHRCVKTSTTRLLFCEFLQKMLKLSVIMVSFEGAVPLG